MDRASCSRSSRILRNTRSLCRDSSSLACRGAGAIVGRAKPADSSAAPVSITHFCSVVLVASNDRIALWRTGVGTAAPMSLDRVGSSVARTLARSRSAFRRERLTGDALGGLVRTVTASSARVSVPARLRHGDPAPSGSFHEESSSHARLQRLPHCTPRRYKSKRTW